MSNYTFRWFIRGSWIHEKTAAETLAKSVDYNSGCVSFCDGQKTTIYHNNTDFGLDFKLFRFTVGERTFSLPADALACAEATGHEIRFYYGPDPLRVDVFGTPQLDEFRDVLVHARRPVHVYNVRT